MEELNKNRICLMRSIVVLTAIIISCTIFTFNNKEDLSNKEITQTEEPAILDVGDVNAIEDVSVSLTYEVANGLFRDNISTITNNNDLKTLNINSIEVVGYLITDPNTKVALVTGTFTCLDNHNTCILAKEKDGNTFKIYVTYTTNELNEYYMYNIDDTSLLEDPNFINEYQLLQ